MRPITFLLLLCSVANAQVEDDSAASVLPDASFRAVAERPVIVRTTNGAELHARIVTVEPSR